MDANNRRTSMTVAKDTLEKLALSPPNDKLLERRASSDIGGEKGEYRRMQGELQNLTFKVRAMEEKVDQVIKDAHMNLKMGTKGVAFTVRLHDHVTVRSLQPIIFDDVLTNYRYAYNTDTGMFKAPVAGRYLLSLTIRAQDQKQASAEIVLEPLVLGQLTAGDTELERATGSLTIIAVLDEGDEVCVRETKLWSGYYYGEGFTLFTGVLID